MKEVEGHEAVDVFVDLRLGELSVTDAFLGQDVVDLGYLGMEVEPLLRVVLDELTALCLLSNYKVGGDFGKFPSLEVVEVTPGKELGIFSYLVVISLSAEYVLLLQGISLAESLDYISKHILKEEILLGVGA